MTTPTQWAEGATIPDWCRDDDDDAGQDIRTPEQLMEDWLATKDSAETVRKYRTNVCHFLRWMATYRPTRDPLADTRRKDVESFKRYLKGPHPDGHPGPCDVACRESFPRKERSANNILSAISSYFDYCIGHGRRPDGQNPTTGLQGKVRISREESDADDDAPVILTPLVTAYMSQARYLGSNYAVIGLLGLGMGMRCSEIAHARTDGWKTRDDGRRVLQFQRKGGDWTTLAVPHAAVEPIDAYLAERNEIAGRADGPLLIPSRASALTRFNWTRGLASSSIYDAVEKTGIRAGISKETIHPHLLRISSITMAYTHPDATEARIAAYYGHSNVRTTRGYRRAKRLYGSTHYPNPVGIDWATQAA